LFFPGSITVIFAQGQSLRYTKSSQ
jgi:hypothetical protein